MKVLSIVNPLYNGLKLDKFSDFRRELQQANKILLSQAIDTFDDGAVERGETMRDDVARIHATTNIHHQANASNDPHANGTFVLQYSYLTTSDKTAHGSYNDSTQVYFSNAVNALGIDVSEQNKQYNHAKSYQAEYPINEFEQGDYGMVAAFPNIFILGTAYKKDVSKLNEKDCIHLLM